jgi:hypothetical protein
MLASITPRVMKGLIKLIKLQLSPNARLNQDTNIWNQIQRQRLNFSRFCLVWTDCLGQQILGNHWS